MSSSIGAGDCGGGGSGGGGRMLLSCSYLEQRLNPRLKALLLWSNPKLTAATLATLLALLLALALRSLLSVCAYAGFAALLCTCALRLYCFTCRRQRRSQQAIEGQSEEEAAAAAAECEPPVLRWLLGPPVRVPRQQLLAWLDRRLGTAEAAANWLLCLLMCRDPVRTFKLFCCLILLTYVGAWFNATTLAAAVVAGAFSLPKLYVVRHAHIDSLLASLLDRYRRADASIRAALPLGASKEKTN